jgi:hypothetical protein
VRIQQRVASYGTMALLVCSSLVLAPRGHAGQADKTGRLTMPSPESLALTDQDLPAGYRVAQSRLEVTSDQTVRAWHQVIAGGDNVRFDVTCGVFDSTSAAGAAAANADNAPVPVGAVSLSTEGLGSPARAWMLAVPLVQIQRSQPAATTGMALFSVQWHDGYVNCRMDALAPGGALTPAQVFALAWEVEAKVQAAQGA